MRNTENINLTEEITLTKTISSSQQGDYITLPFTIPEDVEEIRVQLSFTEPEANVIDLGVEDPQGFRGWSGGARREIFLREDRATPGYELGEILPGEWGVILNAYRVPKECTVTAKVSIKRCEFEWYKGDLHLHSNHSDGAFTVSEVVDNVREAGLQFLALTDHNTFSQNVQYPIVEDHAIIPGVELTTNKGHANFYGVPKPFLDFRCKTKEDVQEKWDEGIANGSIVSINHPHCNFCPWEWGLDNFQVKVIEIWNGPWSQHNHATLEWWDNQLQQGKRIVAIGGSDTHRQHDHIKYGVPTTWINAVAHSPRKLLEGMGEGRVCVAASPKAPWVEIKLGDTGIGEIHQKDEQQGFLTLEVEFKEKMNGVFKVITNQGTVFQEDLTDKSFLIPSCIPTTSLYIRVELWNQELDEPIVISNPIYLR
ncbi:CehA/McbA family metallohydrolase [Alkalihalobacillus sp. TS-13]|uniref:CehA/McbA family metallohydrolase n=1 Tax=Alkalihalobacillus sp. TS-13 TaxID=2842455 RepID=UPI001C886F0D|nr:CehA/McbA family metallohydrolase [Alkalihalobacillus sp. TS-13]